MRRGRKPLPLSLVAVVRGLVWTLLGAASVSLASLAKHDWFGVGDLWPFAYYTAFLCCLVAIVGLGLHQVLHRSRALMQYLAGLFGGAFLGLVFVVVVAQILGPWSRLWSVPAGTAWITAAILGLTAMATTRRSPPLPALALDAVPLMAIAAFFALGLPELSSMIHRDQKLTVVFVKWTEDGEGLTVDGPLSSLSDADVALLKEAGVRGRLYVSAVHTVGGRDRPIARAIVVASGPVDKPTKLAQPDRSTVVYVQRGGTFERFPEDAPVLDREIEILPPEGPTNSSSVRVEHASGARSGGAGFTWN